MQEKYISISYGLYRESLSSIFQAVYVQSKSWPREQCYMNVFYFCLLFKNKGDCIEFESFVSKIIILYYKHVNLCTTELNLIAKAIFGRDMEYDRLKI